jgi:hypothetical protein
MPGVHHRGRQNKAQALRKEDPEAHPPARPESVPREAVMKDIRTFVGKHLHVQTVLIEPTNDCQLDCVTCYRKGRKIGYISDETYNTALSMLPWNTYAVTLNGAGESLMHPEFRSMVNKLNGMRNLFGVKYKIGFSTNGLLLDSDMQAAIIDNVDWINISMDGIGLDHEARRRGSDWETVSSNAEMLIDRGRKRTKVSINLTRMNQSDEEISKFKAYWRGADSVFVTPWHNAAMHDPTLPIDAVGKCNTIHNQAFVLWNGDVTTCCGDLQGVNVCGNILKTPLRKIKRIPGPLCEKCNVWR